MAFPHTTGSGEIPDDFLREVARAPAAAPPVDLSGRTLGRYRVERRLGRGGMGVVYAARDLVLLRPVALKVLPPHLVGDERRGRRLLAEARSAARAAHPGIAAVYDVEEIEGYVLISMELVAGETLRALLTERGQQAAETGGAPGGLPAREVIRIGEQVAVALAHAHRMGVIHRDLKPENVMITGDVVRILDFGLAQIRASGEVLGSVSGTPTGEGRALGTPGYMAPEQARGQPVDARADLFSLGVILYELVTGKRPFSGATAEERLLSVHLDEPEPPSRIARDVPPRLERLILRCLRKRPEERPRDAEEVAEEIRESLQQDHDLNTASRPPSPWRTGGRRWWSWAALVAALVAIPLVWTGPERGVSAPPSPLAAGGATVACPVLEARGVDEPAGWLGAAAASMVCLRARALLGGDPARVRPPAALLDLPRLPADDFPEDPCAAPDARARSLEAGRAADALVDGSVTLDGGRFSVRLALRAADGRTLAEGSGQDEQLHAAVRAAMGPLLASGAMPAAPAPSPSVARVRGAASTEALVALTDFDLALWSGADVQAEAARLATHRAALGPRWVEVEIDLATAVSGGWEEIRAPEIDRSSPAAFAWSAPARAMLDPRAGAAALADEAGALAAAEEDGAVRTALHVAEGRLRAQAGDHAGAGALLLAALGEDPMSRAYELFMSLSAGPGRSPAGSAFAAWHPEAGDAWNALGLMRGIRRGGVGYLQRATAMATHVPLFAVHLGMLHLADGRRDRARAVAAELLSRVPAQGRGGSWDQRRIAAELLLAQVEASEGRPGAAAQRARDALFHLPVFGRIQTGEVYLITLLLDVAVLLDQPSKDADAFVEAFVDPEPVRLSPGAHVVGRAAAACALSSAKAAARCFARLRGLVAAGYFREPLSPDALAFVDGAEAFSRADFGAAAAAFRPLSKAPGTLGQHLLPITYDRAGEPELADALDARAMRPRGAFDGLSPAHARAAERAFARGDLESARPLAKRIIDVWGTADVPIPAVSRMRALLEGERAPRATAAGR